MANSTLKLSGADHVNVTGAFTNGTAVNDRVKPSPEHVMVAQERFSGALSIPTTEGARRAFRNSSEHEVRYVPKSLLTPDTQEKLKPAPAGAS